MRRPQSGVGAQGIVTLALGRYERQSGLALSTWNEELALTLAPGERREIELP